MTREKRHAYIDVLADEIERMNSEEALPPVGPGFGNVNQTFMPGSRISGSSPGDGGHEEGKVGREEARKRGREEARKRGKEDRVVMSHHTTIDGMIVDAIHESPLQCTAPSITFMRQSIHDATPAREEAKKRKRGVRSKQREQVPGRQQDAPVLNKNLNKKLNQNVDIPGFSEKRIIFPSLSEEKNDCPRETHTGNPVLREPTFHPPAEEDGPMGGAIKNPRTPKITGT